MGSLQPAAATADEGRYEFERTLGQGGAGAVYLVRDRETGEQLALKKLLRVDAKTVLRLKREFRSLADMHHANLVKLYDLGHARDAWFFTMEYVPGTDLRSYVGRASSTGVDDLARLLATFHQLACGVRALHGAGMLHRDLKPSNVLVSDQDRVVVLDFGLVRELEKQSSKLTEDGVIAGTPVYMAPEQALDKQLTEASDWYAFGVMLYEALSGQLPFNPASPRAGGQARARTADQTRRGAAGVVDDLEHVDDVDARGDHAAHGHRCGPAISAGTVRARAGARAALG